MNAPSLSLSRLPPGRPRPLVLIVAAAVVIGATYAIPLLRPVATPPPAPSLGAGLDVGVPLPAGEDPAAVRGPDGRLSLDERIAFWAGRVERNPKDVISLIHLVTDEMAKARITADLALYQQAEAQLAHAATLAPALPEIDQLRAALAYTLHDFSAAVAQARPLASATPPDVAATAVLADSLTELGRYDEAAALYERLEGLAPGPALDARRARFAYLTGHEPIDLARAARDRAAAAPTVHDPAFYQVQLGETARLTGRSDEATVAFSAALEARPRDLGALIGMARVRAAGGETEEAITLLRRATTIAPQVESLILLGDLLVESGRAGEGAAQYDTIRAIEALGDTASVVYDRQLLLFELDHGGATPALAARAEAALAARADIFGWDLVAWARFRLGRLDGAAEAMDRALATGCRDARLLFHAGAIQLARGERAEGISALQRALALGPALDPLQRAEAERSLASAEGA